MPAAGSGLPPVLLLHGSGPGVSAAEKRAYGRAAWTKHAVSVLDAVGIGQVDVIGNSMGGAVALAMAATRPAAIRRIVLMGSMGVAMAAPPGLDAVWGYRPGVEVAVILGRPRRPAARLPPLPDQPLRALDDDREEA